ncbi:MAG: ketopantoate reductase family protein [Nitrospirae bacterium]|nr:ketopantoate reductase family protein [Nitrospirota bacterium]
MKILVAGAGAVGGYFGALLCQSGADITFLVRKTTGDIIREKGLSIESVTGNILVHPNWVIAEQLKGTYDLIILTVKCYDLEELFTQIRPAMASHTLMMTLQNGIDTEERAVSLFGRERVIGGVAFITAKLIEKGRIGHYKRGIITIGELNGEKSERLINIHQILTDAKISAFMTSEIMKKKWEKLCWNATFNPLSVILNAPVSEILESSGALSVIRQVIQEIIAVARENGVALRETIAEETIQNSFELKEYFTSMYEDWKSGKPTENRYLNGMLCQKGASAQIATPMNYILFQAVEALSKTRQIISF